MPGTTDPIVQNVQTIAELERTAAFQRTRLERLTDAITEIAGSPAFIIFHAAWFGAWIAFNTRSASAFDPWPFSLLNMLVSLEAIFLTGFVLMTQNRMTRLADRRAHLDLQINLLAEQELTAMLHMLHGLCQKAGVRVSVRDAPVDQLLKETDIHKLAGVLEAELQNQQTSDAPDKSA